MSRKLVERVLDIIVGTVISPTADAGWHQTSTLAMMIDFAGDLPKGGGGAGRPEDKMLREISYVRNQSKRQKASIALFLLLNEAQQQVLYYDTRFRKTPNPATDKLFTQRDLAAMCGMTHDQYTAHKRRGMKALADLLDKAEPIKSLFC